MATTGGSEPVSGISTVVSPTLGCTGLQRPVGSVSVQAETLPAGAASMLQTIAKARNAVSHGFVTPVRPEVDLMQFARFTRHAITKALLASVSVTLSKAELVEHNETLDRLSTLL